MKRKATGCKRLPHINDRNDISGCTEMGNIHPDVDTCVVSVQINFRQGQRQSSLCRAQERKEIDDYGENDEYKNRRKHIYKEDWADSIYCPLSFQRRGKGNHAGKD